MSPPIRCFSYALQTSIVGRDESLHRYSSLPIDAEEPLKAYPSLPYSISRGLDGSMPGTSGLSSSSSSSQLFDSSLMFEDSAFAHNPYSIGDGIGEVLESTPTLDQSIQGIWTRLQRKLSSSLAVSHGAFSMDLSINLHSFVPETSTLSWADQMDEEDAINGGFGGAALSSALRDLMCSETFNPYKGSVCLNKLLARLQKDHNNLVEAAIEEHGSFLVFMQTQTDFRVFKGRSNKWFTHYSDHSEWKAGDACRRKVDQQEKDRLRQTIVDFLKSCPDQKAVIDDVMQHLTEKHGIMMPRGNLKRFIERQTRTFVFNNVTFIASLL